MLQQTLAALETWDFSLPPQTTDLPVGLGYFFRQLHILLGQSQELNAKFIHLTRHKRCLPSGGKSWVTSLVVDTNHHLVYSRLIKRPGHFPTRLVMEALTMPFLQCPYYGMSPQHSS